MIVGALSGAMRRSVLPAVGGRRFAAASPWALDLDLAAEALDPRVTFTRASAAWDWNSSGILTQSAAGVWRRAFDPVTLAALGRRVEPPATNSFTRSDASTAVAGSPGTAPTGWTMTLGLSNGVTRSIAAVGSQNGLPYMDVQFSGTFTGAENVTITPAPGLTTIAASPGQSWAMSLWWGVVAGTLANTATATIGGARIRFGSPSLLAQPTSSDIAVVGFSAGVRPAVVGVAPASTTVVGGDWVWSFAAGQSVNFTVRIGPMQLEQGTYATSYIPTTGAAVTRAADSAVITGANFSSWYSGASECTIYAEGTAGRVGTTALACLDSGSNSEFMGVLAARSATSSASGQVFAGGVLQADWFQGTHTGGAKRVAMRVKANSVRVAANGTLIGAEDTTAVYPTVDRLILGQRSSGGVELAGTLKTVRIARVGFGDADLAALTA